MSSFEDVINKIKENKDIIRELEKEIKQREKTIQNLNIEQRNLCPHSSFSDIFILNILVKYMKIPHVHNLTITHYIPDFMISNQSNIIKY
jgi:hypothetical protein